MSPAVNHIQHLEEFSSFVSCLKCFGRPILPPLVTQDQREGIQQMREAAMKKEVELIKYSLKKNTISAVKRLDFNASSSHHANAEYASSNQEACALWYPSFHDHKKYSSIAISKMPTSNIFSSVHTDAIVCADVIENSGTHVITKKSGSSKENSRCSHSRTDFDCCVCEAECDSSFQDPSFASELSPEVPCRIDSLNQNFVEDDQNSVAETDCDSLPTVICGHKHDTDTESSVTYMTQSTDLDKYMEVPSELNSSDNSAGGWDSQSTSQQFIMERSDEASSGTVVNTENELTPCASTLAELTDNIDDEFSAMDEAARDLNPVKLRRAHSVDSYMKIIQLCAQSAQVRKSTSEPLNASFKMTSHSSDCAKVSAVPKTGQLIKEDSKESEESNCLPEKDAYSDRVHETDSLPPKNLPPSDFGDKDLLQRNHVRKNSYTLDHPSPVLIKAHGDCNCSFDGSSSSPPHCFALEDKATSNAAFTIEKVEIKIPVSLKAFPVLNASTNVDQELNKEISTSPVKDVTSKMEKNFDEESYSEIVSKGKVPYPTNIYAEGGGDGLNFNCRMESDEKFTSPTLSVNDQNQEQLSHICRELQEHYETQVKKLMEEQNRQLLKLTLEFKEKEKILYENMKQSIPTPFGASFISPGPTLSERDSIPEKDNTTNLPFSINLNREQFITATDESQNFDKQNSFDSHCMQSQDSDCPSSNAFTSSNFSKTPDIAQDSTPMLSPPEEHECYHIKPSAALGYSSSFETNQNSFDMLHTSESGNGTCSSDNHFSLSENKFPYSSAVLLPQYDPENCSVPSSVALNSPCVCEKMSLCSCLGSPNSFENILNSSNSYVGNNAISTLDSHSLSANRGLGSGALPASNNPADLKLTGIAINKKIKSSTSLDHVHAGTKSASDVLQPSNSSKGKVTRSTSVVSLGVPVNDIISLCVKSVKNGPGSSRDLYNNKKIEIPPPLLKQFEKLPAFVKGYLTRRLFKTERVQNLIKTLQDTAVLIRKVSEDVSLKGNEVSEKDVIFHRQLIVQLMTTFHNVYDIFCTINTKEQMKIISESRNSRLKKEMEQKTVLVNAQDSEHSRKQKIPSSAAKALERKKRSVINTRTYTLDDVKNLRSRSAIDSRTYTIEDLKGHVGRSRSQSSSKSHPASPTSIYKTTVGLAHKRKTASCKQSSPHRSVQHNWVP